MIPAFVRVAAAVAAVVLLSCGTVSKLAAQRPAEDMAWTRRPGRGGIYQAVRELSGRVEVARFRTPSDPANLTALCNDIRDTEAAAADAYEKQAAALERQPAARQDAAEYLQVEYDAAQMRAYLGDLAGASRHFRAALDRVSGQEPATGPSTAFLSALLGVSELRRGELENCVHDRNAARCIFPILPAGEHEHTSGSEAALASLLRSLTVSPDDLELRWLANLAAMTLGRHPGALPPAYQIDRRQFAPTDPFPPFTDAAPGLGLDLIGRAGGAVLEDFNGDGRLDLALSSVDRCEPLHLFVQGADGRFTDTSEGAGLSAQLGGINLVQTDYNNDGRPDLYVMRGGWETPIRNSLLMNTGSGFRDVTQEAGLVAGYRTHSAVWADFDLDGWLDVFVGHEEASSRLYRNNGNGTFSDITDRAGIKARAFTKGVTSGDYDRDGAPDLFLSNYGEPNILYRNNGDGTFTDVTTRMGVAAPMMSFSTWFFDYDNDGWEDLFVAGFVPSVAEAVKHYIGEPPSAETMCLWRNIRGQRFENVTAAAGLRRVVLAMGANYADVDNDGWLDFYLGTGAPSYAALVPNLLFRNRDGRSFADVTTASGTGHLQKGHGIAFGDIDRDGDEDLFVNVGGFVPGDTYARVLFRNPGNEHAWVDLQLRGTRTNRMGIGARVSVTAVTPDGVSRVIPRVVSSGGSFGASPLVLHIGLGDASSVPRVEIYWPVSRVTQVIERIPLRRTIVIEEGAAWKERDAPGSARSRVVERVSR